MNNIKQLYNKLSEDYRSLSCAEIQILFNDFQNRATGIIGTNNAGKYSIRSNCPDYIFNGFAIIKQNKKMPYSFRILIDKDIDVSIDDDMEIFLVNCDAILIEQYNKPENNISPVSSTISVKEVVIQLERIQALRQSGAITDDEFFALKNQILKEK